MLWNQDKRVIFGMVHLSALPGTPYYVAQSFQQTCDAAIEAATTLERGGADGCLVQTVDRVYTIDEPSDPARIVAMGLIIQAIAKETKPHFRIGVQMMRNAIRESLAVAKVAGGHFVRATALVGSTEADNGVIHANPYEVVDYRRALCANNIELVADIASIHHRPNRDVTALARHAHRVGANAVAVGDRDEKRMLRWIKNVRHRAPDLPILLAGHTNHSNAARLLAKANGAFVGSCFESDGWGSPICEDRVKSYMDIARGLPPMDM